MPEFEVQAQGKTYEVQAPTMEAALSALQQGPKPDWRSETINRFKDPTTAQADLDQGMSIAGGFIGGIKRSQRLARAGMPGGMPEDANSKIREMFNAGMTQQQIAKELGGVDPSLVWHRIQKMGLNETTRWIEGGPDTPLFERTRPTPTEPPIKGGRDKIVELSRKWQEQQASKPRETPQERLKQVSDPDSPQYNKEEAVNLRELIGPNLDSMVKK